MIDEQLLHKLRDYEGKWVALIQRADETEIVGVGEDAVDASKEALKSGYTDATLLKVHPGNAAYVPLA